MKVGETGEGKGLLLLQLFPLTRKQTAKKIEIVVS